MTKSEEMLAASWGHHALESATGRQAPFGGFFRAPLPEAPGHRAMRRSGLECLHPPYFTALEEEPGTVRVMLCEGNGIRAGVGRREDTEYPFEAPIYADGDNIPDEWRLPIAAAMGEVRNRWPSATLLLRD